MISSKRRRKATHEGKRAAIATNCNPLLTKNPYTKGTAQWKAFNIGWNDTKRKFKFLMRVK